MSAASACTGGTRLMAERRTFLSARWRLRRSVVAKKRRQASFAPAEYEPAAPRLAQRSLQMPLPLRLLRPTEARLTASVMSAILLLAPSGR